MVALICQTTQPSQWKYEDTQPKVMHDLTRGLSAEACINNTQCKKGPDFLWKTQEHWPQQLLLDVKLDWGDQELMKKAHKEEILIHNNQLWNLFSAVGCANQIFHGLSFRTNHTILMLGQTQPLPIPYACAKSTLQSMLGYYGRHTCFCFRLQFEKIQWRLSPIIGLYHLNKKHKFPCF